MSAVPQRIQRGRQKGWRQPDNAISVTRPSRWGNIFYVTQFNCVYGPSLRNYYCFDMPYHTTSRCVNDVMYRAASSEVDARAVAVDLYRNFCLDQRKRIPRRFEDWISPLRGRDLGCWCPLDQPCHADVLLELSNGGGA